MTFNGAIAGLVAITEVNLLKKVRLEIAVNADLLKRAIEAIISGALTGKIGDGKIFVTELIDCIRKRTGEEGETALGRCKDGLYSLASCTGPEDFRRTQKVLSQEGPAYPTPPFQHQRLVS